MVILQIYRQITGLLDKTYVSLNNWKEQMISSFRYAFPISTASFTCIPERKKNIACDFLIQHKRTIWCYSCNQLISTHAATVFSASTEFTHKSKSTVYCSLTAAQLRWMRIEVSKTHCGKFPAFKQYTRSVMLFFV